CIRGIELRDLELDFRADGDRRGRGAREERREPGRLHCGVEALRQVGFVEVDDNQQRFRGEKLKSAQPFEVVAFEVERAQRTAFLYAATSTSAAAAPVPAGSARSENSTVAGTRFFGLYIAVSRSRRASGTFDIPTVASPLPWAVRPVSRTLVMSWKRVDFPLDATPMRAALSMDETRIVPDGDRKPIRGASDVDRMCCGCASDVYAIRIAPTACI